MSNKLEAALGPFENTFTDAEGDAYTVSAGNWLGEATITLTVNAGVDDPDEIIFFKADATKIIALIAEAAK